MKAFVVILILAILLGGMAVTAGCTGVGNIGSTTDAGQGSTNPDQDNPQPSQTPGDPTKMKLL